MKECRQSTGVASVPGSRLCIDERSDLLFGRVHHRPHPSKRELTRLRGHLNVRFGGVSCRCPISRTTREEGHAEYEESRLVCEAHDECQGDIQSRDVAIVKAADLPTKAGAPNRDQLVSHHVRPRAQTVSSTGAVRAWPSFVQLLAPYE